MSQEPIIRYTCNPQYGEYCDHTTHDPNSVKMYYATGVSGWKGLAKVCSWWLEVPGRGGFQTFNEVCPQCYQEHP